MAHTYKVLEKLGSGSQGEIFKAIDKTENTVALKIFKHPSNGVYEFHMLKYLQSHANIIDVYDTYQDKGDVYVVMEYMNGDNLFVFLQKVKHLLTENIIRGIIKSILNGLKHIHSKGVVHRDLKLENIMINEQNKIKIIDFGLAAKYEVSKNERNAIGSVPYIAPEMQNGNGGGYKIDSWALGIILFELLFGNSPFLGDNIYDQHLHIPNTRVISNEVKHLLYMLLLHDQSARYSLDQISSHPWMNHYTIPKYKLWKLTEYKRVCTQSWKCSFERHMHIVYNIS
tara:strand:- start:49 stop:900 length:852 start_codon:yes stop_codon:yes gene_type:complete